MRATWPRYSPRCARWRRIRPGRQVVPPPTSSSIGSGAETRARRGFPGKHGASRSAYTTILVLISDTPGELARLFTAARALKVNIEDLTIEHSPGRQVCHVTLYVAPEVAPRLAAQLAEGGWTVQN